MKRRKKRPEPARRSEHLELKQVSGGYEIVEPLLPWHHYVAVMLQPGGVLLDSDWNE
jgi:hypothetical protein